MKTDFKFHHKFKVRFVEVDMHGHVFNGTYYTYFDTAVSEFLHHLNLDEIIKVDNTGCVFHVIKTSASYYAPVYFNDVIEVYVRISKIGITSLSFYLEIYRSAEDKLLTTGEVVWVNTNGKTRLKTPISPKIRATLTNTTS
jgi:acyl-CoA thioester hydrolase